VFIRFDTTHEHDRHTDRHRMTAKAALDASIAWQKGGFNTMGDYQNAANKLYLNQLATTYFCHVRLTCCITRLLDSTRHCGALDEDVVSRISCLENCERKQALLRTLL